ncbi:uncharacterized protein [Dysidea avara]|uniref:uncharacterized protein isoform X2 n=1 Tax=Dysidea avara TaxID=196820 RepID=UPI00331C6CCD
MADFKDLTITGVKLSDSIGYGAYGSVFKAVYDGAACAGKRLHDMFVEANVKQVKKEFQHECRLHSKLVHPNIVKMLGVYYPSDQATLPVLVMELMDCSLTSLLESSQNLPVYFKLSVLRDVSKGLGYLHTLNPPVIHRNLNCNNILLTKSRVAKISDFVDAREAPFVKHFEKPPGIIDFMPPEAKNHQYALPYDLFSFGCVICHVGSQQWPKPVPQTYKKESEAERRQHYIGQFSTEPLKKLTRKCLSDDPERRPTISQVCKEITSMITECHYKDGNIKMEYLQVLKEQVEIRNTQLLMIGTKNAGKTSLVSSFLGEEFVDRQVANEENNAEIQKIYCKNWKRMSKPDKATDLHDQFIDYVTQYIRIKCLAPSILMEKEFLAKSVDASCTMDSDPASKNTSHTAYYDLSNLNGIIWDFMGEAVFHNTQSPFISEYTVPVITFDASKELTDEIAQDEGSYQSPKCHSSISGIHYWLKVVDSVCSVEGEDGHLQPTAILAGTHIDKLHPDLKVAREIAKDRILPQLEKELFEKRYAQHLAGFVKNSKGLKNALKKFCFFISNKFRDEEIERLKNTASEAAASMNRNQPVYILKIEEALLQCKEHIISKSDMLDLVTNHSLPMTKNSPDFEDLLIYLHEKRTILYFSQVESMKKLMILSPWWLVRLFSYIIAAHSYVGSDCDEEYDRLTKYGVLHGSLFQHMLDKFYSDFPTVVKATKEQIIDILLHLNMMTCITRETWFSEENYPLLPEHGDTFIVPFHVPCDDRKNPPNTTQQRVIYFKFDDGFVPIGLLNKLIAKCICRSVKKRSKLLWMRYGKVGLHLGAHQIYYISHCEEKGSIQLTITMPDKDDLYSAQERRELINDITRLLDDILKEFLPAVKKRPIRFVPCPHCPILHVTLSDISNGKSIFCATSNDTRLPPNHYDDLLPNITTTSKTDRKLEVFRKHYSSLTSILPVKRLTSHFVSENVISFEEEDAILQTVEQSQAACKLLKNIRSSLEAGQTSSLDKLLCIMEQHGGLSCVELAKQMKDKISRRSSGAGGKLEVFTDYYGRLATALPFKELSCHFVTARIISSEENQAIQQTAENSEMASLVFSKIHSSLQAGQTEMFDKFLLILDAHDNGSCIELANQMRAELSRGTADLLPPAKSGTKNKLTKAESTKKQTLYVTNKTVVDQSSSLLKLPRHMTM